MFFSRRKFLAGSAGFSLLSLARPSKLVAAALKDRPLAGVDGRQNLFMAFNNIRNPEEGESDEFTTIRNIERVLAEVDVPRGSTVIGIGARTGSANDPYSAPGEMGYAWEYGTPFRASVTSIKDASATPLNVDDPIPVTQIAVLDESTAHRFEYDDPSRAGTALWNFYKDETTVEGVNLGMHNTFSDRDGGMLEAVFDQSQAALKNPKGWATSDARKSLQKFMPRLREDKVWKNLAQSMGNPVLHSEWLPYIRQQGWQGAAVILRGSMMNVAQFHLQEWNRHSPADPKFKVGSGMHGPLKIQMGQEVRPFITPAEGAWTMVGFIWDLENKTSTPSMREYESFSDLFGQDYHIHGFQDNGSIGGHTHFSALGEGKLSVSLYPLKFEAGKTAFLFNNDLKFDWGSLKQSTGGLKIKVRNDGQNFVRNLAVQLAVVGTLGHLDSPQKLLIPKMAPGESIEIYFQGDAGRAGTVERELWLDRDGHFIEGGEGTRNNRYRFGTKTRR
jgi:hypothetical protein